MDWYPQNKNELSLILNKFLKNNSSQKRPIHGIIVPHAGYNFSGELTGKAFSLLLNKPEKAIVLGPSHNAYLTGIASIEKIQTPLGQVKIAKNPFPKLKYEHSIDNQIPFLQKLNPDIEILPLVIGKLTISRAEAAAKQLSKENALFVFSTDLSHFLPYKEAIEQDKKTIKAILDLDTKKLFSKENSACGIFPLMILIELCKIKNYKPKLIEYKNSGDITQDKNSVVGYASMYF